MMWRLGFRPRAAVMYIATSTQSCLHPKFYAEKGHTEWSPVKEQLGASSFCASDVMSRYSDDARTGVVLLSGPRCGCLVKSMINSSRFCFIGSVKTHDFWTYTMSPPNLRPTCLDVFMVNNPVLGGQNQYFSWFWGLMVGRIYIKACPTSNNPPGS